MRTSAPGQSALMMADIAWPLEARGVRYAVIGFADATLEIVGREGFIAMKAFAGGPVDLADVRVIIDLDRGGARPGFVAATGAAIRSRCNASNRPTHRRGGHSDRNQVNFLKFSVSS
jgi:hypothetical protein